MKICISHTQEEALAAMAAEEMIRALFPGIKVRRNDRYTPYAHIYMTTKRPEKSCDSKENA